MTAPQQSVLANPNTIAHRSYSPIIRDEASSQDFVALANLVSTNGVNFDPASSRIGKQVTLANPEFTRNPLRIFRIPAPQTIP